MDGCGAHSNLQMNQNWTCTSYWPQRHSQIDLLGKNGHQGRYQHNNQLNHYPPRLVNPTTFSRPTYIYTHTSNHLTTYYMLQPHPRMAKILSIHIDIPYMGANMVKWTQSFLRYLKTIVFLAKCLNVVANIV